MIKRKLFTAGLLAVLAFSVVAASAQTTARRGQIGWMEQALDIKQKFHSVGSKDLPYQSAVYRSGDAAGTVSVDITGLEELILNVWGTEDGTDYDWAVWGNAKLYKADGTFDYLSDLEPRYRQVDGNYYRVDRNLNNQPLRVKDQEYEKGLLTHANALLVYDLEEEYTRFESSLGIDNGSATGSAIFRIFHSMGENEAKQLAAIQNIDPEFLSFLGSSLQDWLLFANTDFEKAVLQNRITELNNKAYYTGKVAEIEAMPKIQDRIYAYIALKKEVDEVLRLNSQLQWLNVESVGLAVADMKSMTGFDVAANEAKYLELKKLADKGFGGVETGDKQNLADARRAVQLKREILMANPELDMDKILITKYVLGGSARWVGAPALGTQPNNWSNQYSARRNGFDAQIVELSNLRGDEIKQRVIFKPETNTSVTDVHLHWDADRMLFTASDTARRWHVYEVNTDGTGFKNLTAAIPEPDVEYTDGAYLPDGRLIINTTLGYHGVPCVNGSDAVGNLALFDPKTNYLRRLTFDQDNNWNPTVMNNGRVMYTRWEYTDLIHYFSRFVMHMNPDGTENKNLYGSGSYFPNSTFDMQPLPGGSGLFSSSAFVGIISGHHGTARSGRLMIFDPAKGRKEQTGMTQEIPFRNREIVPLIKDELVDGVWPQFIKPHPLNDKYFLVTAKLDRGQLWGIYLVDIYDNVTLIYEAEDEGYINPIPLRKRPTPPIIPDKVNENEKEATVFIQDIYEGEGLPGVPRGTVKKLRLLAYEYAYRDSPSDHSAQGIQSGWDIKRLLGEVPVEADGSAIFTIPANTPIALQPLDSTGRAIQWMRSWFVGMPGETVSCVGCHEDQNQIPIPRRTIASTKKPSAIELPVGGIRPFTFELEIQPILDRACVACHNNERSAGGRNYTGGRNDNRYRFSDSYLDFHPYFYRQGPEADMYVLTPYEFYATNSEMVQMLNKGHHGVELTETEWKTLYNWVDFNAPYNSSFSRIREIKVGAHGYDQIQRRMELADKYAGGSAVDWQQEIRDYADYLAKQPKPEPVMPQQKPAAKTKPVTVKGWPFSKEEAKAMVAKEGQDRKSIEIAPGITMNFVRIPAGTFVMGSDRGFNGPETKVKIDKGFWMAEMEVSNEQYRALVPEHDNRLIGQFWKDHTGPNYEVNEDWRPAIRVSWEEAMKFGEMISEKTGMKVTLPTEAQWEWAARAGNDGEFWWGDTNTDFSPYENLADWNLRLMAVSGVDPKPMNPESPVFKYWNFIPKIESVNDGEMLLTKSGSYEANPWGLYDMHGNVAEWTRSDIRPYPYNPKADATNVANAEKVVRGGSWYDRPKNATASSRRHFLPWQRVWNVGFRLIIED